MPLRLPSTLAACARWVLGLWLCVALASAFAPLARASGWERLCSAAGESVWVPSPAGQDNALAGSHGIDCPLCLPPRSEEHTSELQSPCNLVCRLLLEKKKTHTCSAQCD